MAEMETLRVSTTFPPAPCCCRAICSHWSPYSESYRPVDCVINIVSQGTLLMAAQGRVCLWMSDGVRRVRVRFFGHFEQEKTMMP